MILFIIYFSIRIIIWVSMYVNTRMSMISLYFKDKIITIFHLFQML